MKLGIFILIILAFNSLTLAQEGSTPREQLKQYVADLQKSPDDQGLREKIIKPALTLDPKPATPEDAERFMARGAAAVKDAKVESGMASVNPTLRRLT